MYFGTPNMLSSVPVPQRPAEPLSLAKVQSAFLRQLQEWAAKREAAPLQRPQPPLERQGNRFRVGGQTLFERAENGALQTYRKDPTTTLRMIEVAKQQQWPRVVAQGSPTFRRQAWLYGAVQGLDVQGYQPTQSDLSRLKVLKNLQNTLQPGKEPNQEPEKQTQEPVQKPQRQPGIEPKPKQAKSSDSRAPTPSPTQSNPGKNPRAAGLQPAPGPKYASRPRTAVRTPQPSGDYLLAREIYKSIDRQLKQKDYKALFHQLLVTPYLGTGREPAGRVITGKIRELLPAHFRDHVPKNPHFNQIQTLFRQAMVPFKPFEKVLEREAEAVLQGMGKQHPSLVPDAEPAPAPKAVKVPRADLGGQLGRQAYQASVKPMPAGPERGMG